MNRDEQWRGRARTALQAYFQKRSAPRLILSAILILTGSVGFAVSVGLMRLGMVTMWIRYPIAVLAAYGFFLGLIRLWIQFEKSRFDPRADEIEQALKEGKEHYTPSRRSGHDDGSSFNWLDIVDFDFGEGCLLIVVIAAIVGLVALLLFTILGAPALVAEVFIDAFVVSVLYRHLRKAAREHWLGTAIKKTWARALGTAALLSLIGWCLEMMAPGSHSIGPAIQKLFAD